MPIGGQQLDFQSFSRGYGFDGSKDCEIAFTHAQLVKRFADREFPIELHVSTLYLTP